jgi:hypothetical protein
MEAPRGLGTSDAAGAGQQQSQASPGKALRKQGGAGFLVKTFTGQSYGIFLLLFVREVPLGPLGRLWPAEPQGGPFSILPSKYN